MLLWKDFSAEENITSLRSTSLVEVGVEGGVVGDGVSVGDEGSVRDVSALGCGKRLTTRTQSIRGGDDGRLEGVVLVGSGVANQHGGTKSLQSDQH